MSDELTNDSRVPAELQNNVAITTTQTLLDKIYNWGRKRSIWPMQFGLACCAIEMIATAASRHDLARFGWELFRASPRQADLMIVSGTVTKKMVPQIVRLYNQMPEPRYVIAMGACATAGGPFKEGYNVVSGIDKFVPVDVYIPGCPPRPEALLHSIIKLRRRSNARRCARSSWYKTEDPWRGAGASARPGSDRHAPCSRNQKTRRRRKPAEISVQWLKRPPATPAAPVAAAPAKAAPAAKPHVAAKAAPPAAMTDEMLAVQAKFGAALVHAADFAGLMISDPAAVPDIARHVRDELHYDMLSQSDRGRLPQRWRDRSGVSGLALTRRPAVYVSRPACRAPPAPI